MQIQGGLLEAEEREAELPRRVVQTIGAFTAMEPPKAALRINYVIYTAVVHCEAGWVRFDGSQERMFFGIDHHFNLGDQVKITFEKDARNAKPSETPI